MTEPDPKAETAQPVEALREVGEKALAGIGQARRKAGDVIAATRDKGEALIEDTREKSYRAAAETNRLFQEHPIAAVAAAAAAGAVIGIFLPRFAFASRASRVAGRAIKAAVASEAAQILLSTVEQAGAAARAAPPPPPVPVAPLAAPAVESDPADIGEAPAAKPEA